MNVLEGWGVILEGVGNVFMAFHDILALAIGGVDGHREEALVARAIRLEVISDSRFPE